jgi:hypothetical protein
MIFVSLSRLEKAVLMLLLFQAFLPWSVILLEPGFDHPNALGLDFGFVIFVGGLWVLAWLIGFVLSFRIKSVAAKPPSVWPRRSIYVFLHVLSVFYCGWLYRYA